MDSIIHLEISTASVVLPAYSLPIMITFTGDLRMQNVAAAGQEFSPIDRGAW
jgi:hypothetical protein